MIAVLVFSAGLWLPLASAVRTCQLYTGGVPGLGNYVCSYTPPDNNVYTDSFVAPGRAGTTTQVTIVASGSTGATGHYQNSGSSMNPTPGRAGHAVITYTMNAGATFTVVIDGVASGQSGAPNNAGNGGSAINPASSTTLGGNGGGGGGASQVVAANLDRILVAGGGGGAGSYHRNYGGNGGVFDAASSGAGGTGQSFQGNVNNGASTAGAGPGCSIGLAGASGSSTFGGNGGGSESATLGGGGGGAGFFAAGGGCGSSASVSIASGGGGGSSGTDLTSGFVQTITYSTVLDGGSRAVYFYYTITSASGLSNNGRRRTRTVRRQMCPETTETACTTRSGGFECIDTQAEITSCGGCVMEGVAPQGDGQDCTAIQNTLGVACQQGKCIVQSCNFPFQVSHDRTKCVSSQRRYIRR